MKLIENPCPRAGLSAELVHELNNIVFVLTGYLDMILEDLPEEHPCRGFAEEARTATRRAKTLLALPRADSGENPQDQKERFQAAEGRALEPRSGPTRVLLVDDEPMLLEALGMGLANLGFQVRECRDPRRALEIVQADAQGFDVVVSDLLMPEMSGHELAQQILNTRQDLPIILMSGYQDDSTSEIALRAGIDRILPKPLEFKELAAAIVNCVGSVTVG